MPRFVILEHDHPTLHWDLLLEHESVLRAWRLASPPVLSKPIIEALQLPDHRMFYLDYEGPVSGNRGTVSKWDAGKFEFGRDSTSDRLYLQMFGAKVATFATLTRVLNEQWQWERITAST